MPDTNNDVKIYIYHSWPKKKIFKKKTLRQLPSWHFFANFSLYVYFEKNSTTF